MRILFLLPDFPYPPSTGGRLKVFNELVFLSEHHQCDILNFGIPTEQQKKDFLQLLPKVNVLNSVALNSGYYKWLVMLWNILRGLPPSFAAFSSKKYALLVKQYLLASNYDVVHYDIVNMGQYIPLASNQPSVHSPNDATSLVYFRVAKEMPWSIKKINMLMSAILLKRFERLVYPRFSKVHVVSETDAFYLKSCSQSIDISVIPITVNRDYLVKLEANRINLVKHEPKIICTGNLGNTAIAEGVKNFLEIAFPLILRELPSVKLVMLGQNIKPELKRKIAENPNVTFLTWVEDYKKFLSDGDVILVPDCIGPSGAKTRAVQAMALGLPVVGSVSGFEGIPIISGRHGLIYMNMYECAGQVIELFKNKTFREELGVNAHLLIKNHFSLDVLGPKYESLYFDAISRHNSLMYNVTKLKTPNTQ